MTNKEILARTIMEYIPTKQKVYLHHALELINAKVKRFYLYGFNDIPLNCNIEITSECNRNCIYCKRKNNKKYIIGIDTFKSLINQLKDMGFKGRFAPVQFNEPFLDKLLYERLSYVKTVLKCSIIVYTNGDFLNHKKVKRFSHLIDDLRITLHNPISKDRVAYLSSLKEVFSFVSILDMRESKRRFILNNLGGSLEIEKGIKINHCCHINSLYIRANGDVVLCCNDVFGKYIFGNIYEKSLISIWNSFSKLRMEISKGQHRLKICKNCYNGLEIKKKRY